MHQSLEASPVRQQGRNDLWRLSLGLALSQTGVMLFLTVAALTGASLAGTGALATLPLALQFVAMAAGAFPAGLAMRRFGRRAVFLAGQGIGVLAALLAAGAALYGHFALFCAAAFGLGLHNAVWQHYRFAAVELAPPALRSRAIALVLSGGVLAAVLGGQLGDWSQTLLLRGYAGTYLTIAGLCLVTLLMLSSGELAAPRRAVRPAGRPLWRIVTERGFGLAVLCGAVSFAAMAFVMNATPLAMQQCGFGGLDTNRVIQLHTLGMFAPSFVTGRLVRRFGSRFVAGTGILCFGVAVAVNLAGSDWTNFAAALLLVGLGWNLTFISATDMLADAHRPEEAERAQALNDTLLFALVAGTNLLSGVVLDVWGWQWLNLAVLAPLSLLLIMLARRPAGGEPAG